MTSSLGMMFIVNSIHTATITVVRSIQPIKDCAMGMDAKGVEAGSERLARSPMAAQAAM